jgi:hypothetical protein
MAKPSANTRDDSQQPSTGGTIIPIDNFAEINLVEGMGYQRGNGLAVSWQIGPPCTGASASNGKFERLDVEETNSEVRLRLLLRNGVRNPVQSPDEWSCSMLPPSYTAIVNLESPLGSRRVLDVSCEQPCELTRMSEGEMRSIRNRIRIS